MIYLTNLSFNTNNVSGGSQDILLIASPLFNRIWLSHIFGICEWVSSDLCFIKILLIALRSPPVLLSEIRNLYCLYLFINLYCLYLFCLYYLFFFDIHLPKICFCHAFICSLLESPEISEPRCSSSYFINTYHTSYQISNISFIISNISYIILMTQICE